LLDTGLDVGGQTGEDANKIIEQIRDPDGFVEHTKVPQEVRAPDGELLSHDNLRAFVGQHSRKRFTRADF